MWKRRAATATGQPADLDARETHRHEGEEPRDAEEVDEIWVQTASALVLTGLPWDGVGHLWPPRTR